MTELILSTTQMKSFPYIAWKAHVEKFATPRGQKETVEQLVQEKTLVCLTRETHFKC